MRNFNCWAIANLELIFIIPIVLGAMLVTGKIIQPSGGEQINGETIFLWLFVVAAYFLPTKSTKGDALKLVLTIFLIIFLTFCSESAALIIWISSGIGLISAIFVAAYTVRNIDAVVSRRMLYRNSDVDLFEITWKYTFNRLVATVVSITFLFLEILVLCFL